MRGDFRTIDDRSSGNPRSSLNTAWRLVSDTVMGGVSYGQLTTETVHGRACLRLTGTVSLENNGGFVQASLDLGMDSFLDASGYQGVELDVYGNGESYNLHLRTADTTIVWQSYRAHFEALPRWRTVQLPFVDFQAHRITVPLDLRRLKRIGLVAIGRAFNADLCVGRVGLYR
jgi:hypothetical protein